MKYGVLIIDTYASRKATERLICFSIFLDSVIAKFNNANLSRKIFVFYSVTSLFTNIPFQETIDTTINIISNHNPYLNVAKKELKKLFLFATSHTCFIFNSKFYDQIDGVIMGSTFAPVLDNIYGFLQI